MTSTELKIGLTNSARPSSRVLKPPGGGHSNIFAEPELSVNAPRPKYNQQNSSNLNACIGSTDPNQVVEKLRVEMKQPDAKPEQNSTNNAKQNNGTKTSEPSSHQTNDNNTNNSSQRNRVPPGGFSSGGFW